LDAVYPEIPTDLLFNILH